MTVASTKAASNHALSLFSMNGIRLLIIVFALLFWQYVPEIPGLRAHAPVFDPFFISSPQRIYHRLINLCTGRQGDFNVWPYLGQTLEGTILGVIIGTVTGALMGLVFSNNPKISRTLYPFVIILNATPRIALVPIFVIIAGPTLLSSVLTSILVVFFLVFYNAFSGGSSVAVEMLQNARLFGATSYEIMREVRLPYVLVWTIASLPNATSFGLVSVVTAEILTGTLGMGQLLETSVATVDSTLTFSVVVILTVVGVTLVTATDLVTKRVLHWWKPQTEDGA